MTRMRGMTGESSPRDALPLASAGLPVAVLFLVAAFVACAKPERLDEPDGPSGRDAGRLDAGGEQDHENPDDDDAASGRDAGGAADAGSGDGGAPEPPGPEVYHYTATADPNGPNHL